MRAFFDTCKKNYPESYPHGLALEIAHSKKGLPGWIVRRFSLLLYPTNSVKQFRGDNRKLPKPRMSKLEIMWLEGKGTMDGLLELIRTTSAFTDPRITIERHRGAQDTTKHDRATEGS